MLISQEMNGALNVQIGNEFTSSLQYVGIAAYFDTDSLPELAAHFYRQAEEERAHAMKIVKYVVHAGGLVEIPAIGDTKSNYSSAEHAVKAALESEIKVTSQINNLVGFAIKESDYLTHNFLQWFVSEQLEEVSSMETLLKIVQRAGNDLLHVEEYLARRKPLSSVPEGGEGN